MVVDWLSSFNGFATGIREPYFTETIITRMIRQYSVILLDMVDWRLSAGDC
jgi:hypothetical protein